MKKILGWGIALLLLASVINDVGRFFTGARQAEDAARKAASAASGIPRDARNRTTAWRAAYPVAEAAGVRAENIELMPEAVTVYVAYDVRGTWLMAPIASIADGDWDVGSWWDRPIIVRTKARSLF